MDIMQSSSRPKPLKVEQVAKQWDVSTRTVRAWLANGLPAVVYERRKWIFEQDVKIWFAAHLEAHPEEKTRRRQRREKKEASS